MKYLITLWLTIIIFALAVTWVHAGIKFGMHFDEKEYVIINGREIKPHSHMATWKLVTPEEVKEADDLERMYAAERWRPLDKVWKSIAKSDPTQAHKYEAIHALLLATGYGEPRKRGNRFKGGYNEKSEYARRAKRRRDLREGIGDKEQLLKEINEITENLRKHGVNSKALEGEASSPMNEAKETMRIRNWTPVRVMLQGINVRRDDRLSEIAKPMKLLREYIYGEIKYHEFYEPFMIWIDYLKDKDPEFKGSFNHIKQLAEYANSSSPVGSTVVSGSFPVY